jgi:hypothetical protein
MRTFIIRTINQILFGGISIRGHDVDMAYIALVCEAENVRLFAEHNLKNGVILSWIVNK